MSSSSSSGPSPTTKAGWTFPEIHDFPPFYTLQPNLDTRQKQIQLWDDLVLSYCRAMKVTMIDLVEWEAKSELFRNEKIRRYLSLDFIKAIMEDLVSKQRVEYLDQSKLRCVVWWRRLDEWASSLYEKAVSKGLNGSIVTVYEVQHGDMFADTDFHGIDDTVLRRILSVLERQGKATVFQGNDSSDSGIKFA